MRSITKFTALLCLLALVLTALSACGGNEEATSSAAESKEESQVVSEAELFDGLPDVKYDGEDFIILVPGESQGIYAS
ncbi:MAG: hypothetical protein IK047_04915, partial [Clostridia bacterium]|nr:hypothetical protein [Clostridia bacterium]